MPWSIGSSIRVPLPGPNSNSRRRRRARLPGARVGQQRFLLGQALQLHADSSSKMGVSRSMPSATGRERAGGGGLSSMTMSETELSVICKNCGSEVSPYVTECPYCGARLRKRAPKLERRGDGLEAEAAPPPPAADPRAAAPRGGARRRSPLRDAGRDPRLGRPAAGPEGDRRSRSTASAACSSRSTTSGGASSPPPSPTSTSATCSSSRSAWRSSGPASSGASARRPTAVLLRRLRLAGDAGRGRHRRRPGRTSR